MATLRALPKDEDIIICYQSQIVMVSPSSDYQVNPIDFGKLPTVAVVVRKLN